MPPHSAAGVIVHPNPRLHPRLFEDAHHVGRIPGLEIQIHLDPATARLQRFLEARNPRRRNIGPSLVRHLQRRQLRPSLLRNPTLAIGHPIDRGIVHEQVLPITGTTHIHLHQVCARPNRAFDGLQGVLMISDMFPAMGHHHPAQGTGQRIGRPICRPSHCSQSHPKNPPAKHPTPFH
jgi:hypothetical protein